MTNQTSIKRLWKKIKYRYRMHWHAKMIFVRYVKMTDDAALVLTPSLEAQLRQEQADEFINFIITGEKR